MTGKTTTGKTVRALPFEIPLRERKAMTDEERATLEKLRNLPVDQWHVVGPDPKQRLWKVIDDMEKIVRDYFEEERVALLTGGDTIIRVRQIEVEFETGEIEKLPEKQRRLLDVAYLKKFGFKPLARDQISTQLYLATLAMRELIMFRVRYSGQESPNPFSMAVCAFDATAYVMTLIGNLNMLDISQPARARKEKSAKRDQRVKEILAVVEASKKGDWTRKSLAKRFSVDRKTIDRYIKTNERLRKAVQKA